MPTPMSLSDFAAHLLGAEADIRAAQEAAVVRACKKVRTKARNLIGTPQPEWPALKEATMADRVRQGFPANEPLLRTGELRNSIQWAAPAWEDQTTCVGYVFSNSEVARYMEMGTVNIPPRPFIGLAAMGLELQIHEMMGKMVSHAIMRGGRETSAWRRAFHILHRAGEQARDEIFEMDEHDEK